MPIKPELRWHYPIDWPQISHRVRFVRAKGRCQVCGRPHAEIVRHLGDGRGKVPSPALAYGYYLANRGHDLRLIQDYLGHREPRHTARYTRVAAHRFEGLWDGR